MNFSTKAKNLLNLKNLNLKKSEIPKFYKFTIDEIFKNKPKINEFLNSYHSHEIESWGQESRNLAMKKSVGYRNNQLTIITNEYMEAHFDIVQERIALGAIRLSKTLNRLFSKQS